MPREACVVVLARNTLTPSLKPEQISIHLNLIGLHDVIGNNKSEGSDSSTQRIAEMLRRPVYAGYVEVPDWGISLRKGQHDGLISFTTFEKIQMRLAQGAYAPARKDLNKDFPLRGFVQCGDCENPLTACWSKSRNGNKYPYYLCHTKGCESYRKSIPRHKIEDDFEHVLRRLQPADGLLNLAKEMFKHAWEQRKAQHNNAIASLKREAQEIEKQIDGLLNRIVESENGSVASAYEKKITQLERDKLILNEKAENRSSPRHTFEEMFEHTLNFISSPWNLWSSGQLHFRKIVLRLAFSGRISYQRKEGFRTAQVSEPFRLFEFFKLNGKMMEPDGIEPTTSCCMQYR